MMGDKAPFSSSLADPSLKEKHIREFAANLEEVPERFPVLRFLGKLREKLGPSASSCREIERCRPESSVFHQSACMP